MRHLPTLFLITLLAASAASAQTTYNGHGYGFFGFEKPSGGSMGDTMTSGAGGDYFIWRGVGIGVDAAYAFPRREPSEGIGLASVHGSYHYVNRYNPRRFVPFANSGYTLAFRSGTANFAHIGAGMIYWFTDRAGFRFEWRNTFNTEERFLNGIRLGITFR
jgi:hypothetical protein